MYILIRKAKLLMRMFGKKSDNNEIEDIEILDLSQKGKKPAGKKGVKNKEFMFVTLLVLFMLVSMAGYFCYFLIVRSETFINSSYNRRLASFSEKVIRGDIITRDGVVVATSNVNGDGSESRSYPQGRKYAHAVGFNTNGMAGIEKDYNFTLLRSHSFIVDYLINEVEGHKNKGDTIVSSIDSRLQDKAYERLGNYRGAVVAMDPDNGEILCMVSKPDFDPNSIAAEWEAISGDENSSVLLNRATQGLYPPGSVFKIFTALEYEHEGGNRDDVYECDGFFTHNDHTIHCYKGNVHGRETFKEAFAHSCNSTFAEISLGLDKAKLKKLCEDMLFNKDIRTSTLPISKSSFTLDKDASDELTMQTGIGQGNTLVTPIHMAMVACAISNDGVLINPRLVTEVVNDTGFHVSSPRTDKYGAILSKEDSALMQDYMRQTVTNGTASKLNTDRYEAYGKTGTAEFSSNQNEAHSWFVGFAQKEGKKLAISVIMEGAGSGSEYAVPLAKEIFDAYFD